MPADLDHTELLRQVIAADRYPLSPRIKKLRAILDKLLTRSALPLRQQMARLADRLRCRVWFRPWRRRRHNA